MYLIFTFLIIFITSTWIIFQERRKKVLEKSVAIYALRKISWELIAAIFMFLASLVLCYFFIESLIKAYYVLSNSHLIDSALDLFSIETLSRLQTYTLENSLLSEWAEIIKFKGMGLKYLVSAIGIGGSGIITIHHELQKNAICVDGILLKMQKTSWDKITYYQWGELNQGRTLDGYRSYYTLRLNVQVIKIEAWLTKNDTTEVELLIVPDDKGAADKILAKALAVKQ